MKKTTDVIILGGGIMVADFITKNFKTNFDYTSSRFSNFEEKIKMESRYQYSIMG